jgi:hypothetical protein
MRYPIIPTLLISLLVFSLNAEPSQSVEESGIEFPKTKEISGTTLQLNGVATRKAMGIVKVFAGAFYMENPSQDPLTIIESEQVKHFHLHYLTDKATAEKLSDGFVKAIKKANPKDAVERQMANIQKYAEWIRIDMEPGSISESVYIPGKGLTLTVNGEEKGTIDDPEFVEMYFRYNFGEKANKKLRKGYLGID